MPGAVFELGWEAMAVLALAVFWVHTLLIAGAAWLDLRELARLGRKLAPPDASGEGLLAGRIRSGRGPDGALASNTVEQVGRSKGDGVVHFNDAAHRSELFGGEIELASGEGVELAATDDCAVWPDLEVRALAARPASAAEVQAALGPARRGRGYARRVDTALVEGPVWLVGRFERSAAGWRLLDDHPPLVSAIDPRRWVARQRRLAWLFMVATLGLAAGVTVLAAWPPWFGLRSMLGAAAALAFFLGVQPIGVALHDALRTPDRAYLRGSWRA